MKARIIALLCVSAIVLFTSCSREGFAKETAPTESSFWGPPPQNTTIPSTSEQTAEWKIDWNTFEQWGPPVDEEDFEPRLQRYIYYVLSAHFAEIAGRKECDEWEDRYYTLHDFGPDSTKEMLIVSYIKEFNITREQFNKANNEYYTFRTSGSNLGINNESKEIFNADLIYTFNNEKINDYYSRDLKKATEADEWLQEWLKTNKPYNSYSEYLQANAE